MDGNGRWAKQRGLPRLAGHRAGTENIRRVIQVFVEYGIPYLTLYAFSTENWSRPQREVRGLFRLLGEVIDREAQSLHQQGIRLKHLGSLEGISKQLQSRIRQTLDLTRDDSGMTLSLAFNYGGRTEIVDAIKRIVADGIPPEAIDEALLGRYLYTVGLPDPDLIIRTGGEMRLSNFLIWQAAYSEYYATPIFWPDFDEGEIEKALAAYSHRKRRFGGLKEE